MHFCTINVPVLLTTRDVVNDEDAIFSPVSFSFEVELISQKPILGEKRRSLKEAIYSDLYRAYNGAHVISNEEVNVAGYMNLADDGEIKLIICDQPNLAGFAQEAHKSSENVLLNFMRSENGSEAAIPISEQIHIYRVSAKSEEEVCTYMRMNGNG